MIQKTSAVPGAWAVWVKDLGEPPVLSFQTRSAGFGLPEHGDRGWKLSTAASDTERERVFHPNRPSPGNLTT